MPLRTCGMQGQSPKIPMHWRGEEADSSPLRGCGGLQAFRREVHRWWEQQEDKNQKWSLELLLTGEQGNGSWEGVCSWWGHCEDGWNDHRDLEHSTDITDQAAAVFKGMAPTWKAALLWVEGYPTASHATETVRKESEWMQLHPGQLAANQRQAHPSEGRFQLPEGAGDREHFGAWTYF